MILFIQYLQQYFDLFQKFTIYFGSKLSITVSVATAQFSSSITNEKEPIKSVLGNTWKYEQAPSITVLILMNRGDTHCNCDPTDQTLKIYLVNGNNNYDTRDIYKFIWSDKLIYSEGIEKLENDKTGFIEIKSKECIDYDTNENVEILYNGMLKPLPDQNELIINPINDYAQGWACCHENSTS